MDPKVLARISGRVASRVHTAGKIEFIRDQGPLRRDIRAPGYEWSAESLKVLAKILWSAQRAHSFAMGAFRLFSKMPSSDFSPDGMLGGRGYIQNIKDMRANLSNSVEILSSFTDTVQDEISADHWNPSGEDETEINEIVEDVESMKSNPESFVESEYDASITDELPDEESEEEPVSNPDADEFNPVLESDESDDVYPADFGDEQHQTASKSPRVEKSGASELPSDDSPQEAAKSESEMVMHTTTPDRGNYAGAIRRMTQKSRKADSSLPVETLPGPRVYHIGPAEGNEAGHFNDEDVWPSDDPTGAGLYSGVNDSECIYEDWVQDGVSPYSNPTDGDTTVFASVKRLASESYSWLPGVPNDKPLNYYARGLTDDDIEWMRAHSAPDWPTSLSKKVEKPTLKEFWDRDL